MESQSLPDSAKEEIPLANPGPIALTAADENILPSSEPPSLIHVVPEDTLSGGY